MKKSLLLLASMMMSAASFAQWSAPVPSTTQKMADDGVTTQFLYNVEAGGFLAGHNDWNTRASVASKGDSIRMEKVYEDEGKTMETGTWCMKCFPAAYTDKNKWLCVSANAFDAQWVDAPINGTGYPGTEEWVVTESGNYYQFTNKAITGADPGTWGIAEYVKDKKGDSRLYFLSQTATYDQEVDGEKIKIPFFHSDGYFYDKWVFIDSVEYKALQPKVEQYQAAMDLKATIDEAKEKYPSLDFSAPQKVYDNTSSTAKELVAAQAQVTEIINEYNAGLASFDEPMDYKETIGDGSSFSPWTRTFTGTGKTGDTATNTWSTEANNGADGTDMTYPFCQVWTGSGGILSDQKIYQTLPGLAPGLYKLTIDARVYSEAGKLDSFEGAYMYFGDEKIDMQAETPITYSGNKSVLWNPDYFTIIAILKESKDVEFGFEIKDANFNWIAFKKVSLNYYGNKDIEANTAKLTKALYSFEKADEGAVAQQAIIKAYNDAVDAFDAALDPTEIKEAAKTASAAKTVLEANIAAYQTLAEKLEYWETKIAENEGLEGDSWNDFCDFIQSEEDIEGYPTPNPTILLKECTLNTEELTEYIGNVDSLYADAVKNSLSPNTDCTDMLKNPTFSNGFDGWTYKNGNIYTSNDGAVNNVEVFQNIVDIYQEVECPDGIYSLSCQAFERPAGNGKFNGDEEAHVFLFMNDFQTGVINISADVQPIETAENMVNCYISDGKNAVGSFPLDYEFTGVTPAGEDVTGYIPNSMQGASYAFKAGRYVQKVYGLVEGGKMKIGLTSNGIKLPEWVLWANFKLTYEGKTQESISNILPTFTVQLFNYLEEHEVEMTEPAFASATAAAEAADKLSAADELDDLWNALMNVNKALADSKANVAAVTAFTEANDALEEAVNDYFDTASTEAQEKYSEVTAKADDFTSLTTEELTALTEEIKNAAAALKLPANVNEASDDNEIDLSALIVNATFDEIGDFTGWSSGFGAGGTTSTCAECYGKNFDVYQDIAGLPAGIYAVTCQAMYAYGSRQAQVDDWTKEGADKDSIQAAHSDAYLYTVTGAGEYSAAVPVMATHINTTGSPEGSSYVSKSDEQTWYIPNNMAQAVNFFDATDDEGEPLNNYLTKVICKVGEDGKLRIGVKKATGGTNDTWFLCDNFTLTYYGNSSSKDLSGDPVAIESVANETAAPAAIFTISGARVNTLQKGINIVRTADGKVKKVFVK